jgi:hypothetical protein
LSWYDEASPSFAYLVFGDDDSDYRTSLRVVNGSSREAAIDCSANLVSGLNAQPTRGRTLAEPDDT